MESYTAIATGLFLGVGLGICFGWLTRDRSCFFTRFFVRRKIQASSKSDSSTSNDEPLVMSDWGEYKMVLVVRQDLGMGKGKAAAQCCHAAVDLYKKCKRKKPEWMNEWESSGCAKVVLKSPDEDTLIELYAKALSLGLPSTVISDAGRTQIAPGSRTVVGIGPAPKELIDDVTGHLKLY